MEKKPFYITTAIAYTSGKPHIGNLYEIVLADAIARFMRFYGYDVYFQTGTDEHGIKIEEKARAEGKEPKEYVDGVCAIVKGVWDAMDISYDAFVRTTDPEHERRVQGIFRRLYEKGDIYKGEYEGMYCTPCEAFFTDSQLVDGHCPDCGREVAYAKEEAYFFRLSNYQKQLEDYLDNNPGFIQPESRKNEMLNNFIKPGLKDLCVSRTSFTWGIPVDFDTGHVIYVWIDALSNYTTFLGYEPYGESSGMYHKYWPADIHLIGKDILRFHCIYWPIMLMALGEEPPKQVFGHPWLIVGDGKMSKSKGNVLYADDLANEYGLDAVRYFFLKEMPFAQDGTFSTELLIERINGDLVNILGNLANRTLSMVNLYFGGIAPKKGTDSAEDSELIGMIASTPGEVAEKIHEMRVADSLGLVFNLLRRSNKYIDETMPWVLAKEEASRERLGTVLYNLLESLRVCGALIEPFLPSTGQKLLEAISANVGSFEDLAYGGYEPGKKIAASLILFERIDSKETAAKTKEEAKPETAHKDLISIEEFAKMELRTGKITHAEPHKNADKLLVLKVDFGGYERQIVSGIAGRFEAGDLVGKDVVAILNLEPANLRGELSEGMILLAEDEKGSLAFVVPETPIAGGSIVK
ncbi:MAG: methionine--tRNA ligase [Eubacteriaceae bacterium]|nr:methionine--tRNA ligase [Eubacteriaceae bacterium]